MENSKIEWCDHTFNSWIGCTKVSPGCVNCYAEARDLRFDGGIHWGKGAPRRRTSEANWQQPVKWNENYRYLFVECSVCHWRGDVSGGRGMRSEGSVMCCPACDAVGVLRPTRPRVFCASLADWLDDEVPIDWLADLLRLIHDTPHLDWLMLSKRPQNWLGRLLAAMATLQPGPLLDWAYKWRIGAPPANVWMGTTVEDQTRAGERIPALLSIPARVRFLSCEPLLGPVDLNYAFGIPTGAGNGSCAMHLAGVCPEGLLPIGKQHLHWVICGGESGLNARPMHPDWARSLASQCSAAGVAFFFKQWGEWGSAEFGMKRTDAHRFPESGPWAGDSKIVYRVGKHAAGRLLDGLEHSDFPAALVVPVLA